MLLRFLQILSKSEEKGDEALIKLTKELDGLDLTINGLIIDSEKLTKLLIE